MRYGRPAPANPWGAKGLEWSIESPPGPHNFDVQPVVTEEAYDYGDAREKPRGDGEAVLV
jgi:cytochrome c oxidase subunit 1